MAGRSQHGVFSASLSPAVQKKNDRNYKNSLNMTLAQTSPNGSFLSNNSPPAHKETKRILKEHTINVS